MKSQTRLTREGHPYLLLLESAILDAGLRCAVDVERDLGYAQRRFATEGEAFLHTTLPGLASFLENGLAMGKCEDLVGFSTDAFGVPSFLRGFFELVFGPDGHLLESPCADAILCIRQVSRLFKKIELPCSDESEMEAIRTYLSTDVEIGLHEPDVGSLLYHLYKRIGDVLWSSSLADLEHSVSGHALTPKHGSGATADGLKGNAKWASWFWPDRLQDLFPEDVYCAPFHWGSMGVNRILREGRGLRHARDLAIPFSLDGCEPWVQLATVPKTVKTPRIIAVEMTAMQYAQQAVMTGLYDRLCSGSTWLSKHIGFRDQTRNQDLAYRGSLGEGFATLDLSEASDRVHPHYVSVMFDRLPRLRDALMATRTSSVMLTDQGPEWALNKFASMGSGTCFPVETMHFFQIVLASIAKQQQLILDDISGPMVRKLAEGVSVFGDDIIAPERYFECLTRDLVAFGLKVNVSKSFGTGDFRESCGADFFRGVDVKPVYVRQPFPFEGLLDPNGVNGWLELSNQLYKAGFWLTAEVVAGLIGEITGPLPVLHREGAGCLHLVSHQGSALGHLKRSWSRTTQTPLYSVWAVEAVMVNDPLEGYPALKKCLSLMRSPRVELVPDVYDVTRPVDHLMRSAKPYSIKLRKRRQPLGQFI